MPQTGPDLVGAGYPTGRPLSALLGGQNQLVQPNLPARSNIEFFGLGNPTDGTLGTTGVATSVAVPALPGDTFSKITFFAGATAEATVTHAWGAVYSGIATPALLAQSVDSAVASGGASGTSQSFTLASPVPITSTNAPNGFVYVSINFTASTVPTAAVMSIPTAVQYAWYSTSPLFLSATHGSALVGVAPATIATPAAKAVAPIVVVQ